jgi:hypothetical protein
MSTVQEIEAAIPSLKREEIEALRAWIDDSGRGSGRSRAAVAGVPDRRLTQELDQGEGDEALALVRTMPPRRPVEKLAWVECQGRNRKDESHGEARILLAAMEDGKLVRTF